MDTITTYFATQGILGMIAIMFIGVIVWQQKRVDSKDKQITDLQNQRILDASQYTTNYIAIAKETVETSKDNLSALSLLQRSVDSLATTMQKQLDKQT